MDSCGLAYWFFTVFDYESPLSLFWFLFLISGKFFLISTLFNQPDLINLECEGKQGNLSTYRGTN